MPDDTTLTLDERRALCGEVVTLNGRPAVIMGAQNPVGGVYVVPDGPGYQWSWPAIQRVVRDHGGEFHA